MTVATVTAAMAEMLTLSYTDKCISDPFDWLPPLSMSNISYISFLECVFFLLLFFSLLLSCSGIFHSPMALCLFWLSTHTISIEAPKRKGCCLVTPGKHASLLPFRN